MRIALGLEYNGAPFHGWQSQADGSGVQDALERALAAIAGARAHAVAAGRTDAGVHATLQVAHFDTDGSAFESDQLAPALGFLADSLGRLHAIEGPVPLNAWLHDRGHWHIEVLPRLTVFAGIETSSINRPPSCFQPLVIGPRIDR